jgi:hypothetical protein
MIRRLLIAALFLYGISSFAMAGERTDSYLFHCSLKAADLGSTEYALSRGAYEGNPMPGMQSLSGRVAWGVGTCAVVSEVDYKLRKSPKARWAVRILAGGLMVYAIGNNVKVGRAQHR